MEQNSWWSRLAPWAGIVFAVLFTAGFFVHGMTPENDDADEWAKYWDDSGNRAQACIGMFMMIGGLFAFMWFGRDLLARLTAQAGQRTTLLSIAQSASTLFVGVCFVAIVIGTTIAGSVEFGDAPVPAGSDLAIMLDQLAIGLLLLPAALSGAAYIAAVSEVSRTSGALPTWLVWVGFAAAALQLVNAIVFVTFVLIPVWALVASVVLLLKSRSQTVQAGAASPA